ncbi:hypothetical protein V2A60_002487 [Cordyceps javanica]
MEPRGEPERDQLLLKPGPGSVYETAMLCGRYLKNRTASVSKSIKSTGSAAALLFASGPAGQRAAAGDNGGVGPRRQPPGQHPSSPTAYLSGLRGVAAVVVFLFHSTWAFTGIVDIGYGVPTERDDGNGNKIVVGDANRHLLQLPFLRLVHAGHAMVGVFFLVGGYVNAVKPLRLMRGHRHAELPPAVAASLLRRGLRLYLPALAAMLATALLAWCGAFEPARRNMDTLHGVVFYWPDFHPSRHDTLAGTLAEWRAQALLILDPWRQPVWPNYDPHLWTVGLEYRASLVLSLGLSALACCRVGARLGLLALLAAFMVRCDRWEVALFLAGAVLAEVDLVRKDAASVAAAASPTSTGSPGIDGIDLEAKSEDRPARPLPPSRRMLGSLGIVLLAVAGMYLMSFPPEGGQTAPGFVLVSRWLVPSWAGDAKRYVHGAGALLFLVAVSGSAALQRPFLTRTAQYLGTVSYSLYIVHGPVMHSVGYLIAPAVLAATRAAESDARWATGVILATIINFAISLATADLFYRTIDVGSMRVATAFQKLCSLSRYQDKS